MQVRAESLDPAAPDVTYTATDTVGKVTFTYRVSDGSGTSSVATVTVDVTARPDEVVVDERSRSSPASRSRRAAPARAASRSIRGSSRRPSRRPR